MKTIKISFVISVVFCATASLVMAQGNYTLMEDLPTLGGLTNPDLPSYLGAVYKFGVILAAVLAVLMIVFGGIRYMTAGGNTGSIGDAKDMIWQAILGLLLVLGSWLILYVVNPNLLSLQLQSVQTVDPGAAPQAPGAAAPSAPGSPTGPCQPPAQGCSMSPPTNWNYITCRCEPV
jgi:amino acid transporter